MALSQGKIEAKVAVISANIWPTEGKQTSLGRTVDDLEARKYEAGRDAKRAYASCMVKEDLQI